MKKINWKPIVMKWRTKATYNLEARMGNVNLLCSHYKTLTGKHEWRAMVSINYISSSTKKGPFRRSLAKATDDAARLVEEMLMDYYTSITREMKCCGVGM
jgi:hypothetical protein